MFSMWTSSVVLIFGLLELCCAKELNCSAYSKGDTTTYEIHDNYKYFKEDNDDCDYSWYNISDTVFAHQQEKIAFVKSWSINHLTIKGCHPTVFLKRNCISEGKEFTGNCSTSCGENLQLPEFNDNPNNSTLKNDTNHFAVYMAVGSISLVFFCGLLYIKRKQIFRKRSWGQMGCTYSAAKAVDINSSMA